MFVKIIKFQYVIGPESQCSSLKGGVVRGSVPICYYSYQPQTKTVPLDPPLPPPPPQKNLYLYSQA